MNQNHAINLAGGKWQWIVEFAGEEISRWKRQLGKSFSLNRFVVYRDDECRRHDEHRLVTGKGATYRLQRQFHWPPGLAADDQIRFAFRLPHGHLDGIALDGQPLTVVPGENGWRQTQPVFPGDGHAPTGAHVLELVLDERLGGAITEGGVVLEVELRIFAGRRGKP